MADKPAMAWTCYRAEVTIREVCFGEFAVEVPMARFLGPFVGVPWIGVMKQGNRHPPMGRYRRNDESERIGAFRAPIANQDNRSKGQIVRRVCEALEREYGTPRHGNPAEPLDDLIAIMLSNKTGPAMAGKVFRDLKERFPRWDDVLRQGASSLEKLLRPAGLSRVKSKQIRSSLKRIRHDFGSCDLTALKTAPAFEAETYLTSLPGVSDKVAKCVLMFTCGGRVLPVDAHVHRIARRLGWTVKKRADQCHSELESLVPPHRRYTFHVDCVAHGRLVCRPARPACAKCCIKAHCLYYRGEL